MKAYFLSCLMIMLTLCGQANADSPREFLQISVNKLLAIASQESLSEKNKRLAFSEVISSDVDFTVMSKRIVSKHWRKATMAQRQQFKDLFLTIMVNTYYSLLKNYSDEQVLFLKEQIKRSQYAIVDTQIVAGNKKIPVRYRLIKSGDSWKIYDFIPEGISFVSSYKKNYAPLLKSSGMNGLLAQMIKKQKDRE